MEPHPPVAVNDLYQLSLSFVYQCSVKKGEGEPGYEARCLLTGMTSTPCSVWYCVCVVVDS